MPTLSSAKMVHPQEDIGLPTDYSDFGGAYKICGNVWRSIPKPMVWVS
jgi:hypothetical protein